MSTEHTDNNGIDELLADRAKTVMDMFDLAGAPVKPCVARLVSLTGGEALEVLEGDTVIKMGRSKEIPYPYRQDNARLSSNHCEIHLSPATLVVSIKDTSTNGTFLNGARLEKGKLVELASGDTISLLNSTALSASDSGAKLEYLFQRLKASLKVEQMSEELTCGVCRCIFYRACTVLPCLHVFCGHCISQCLKHNSQCPECRADVYEIRPTHKINNLVDQLLLTKPELKRSAEEIADCEKNNDIPPTGKVIKKRPREEEDFDDDGDDFSDDDEGSGDDDEEVAPMLLPHAGPHPLHFKFGFFGGALAGPPVSCAQCTTPADDGYICPPGAIHIRCFSCKTPFPERPLAGIPQRCEMCKTPFCDLYLGGCKNPSGVGYLQPVKDHTMETLPLRSFGGNTVEQSILSSYLAASGLTVPQTWSQCLKEYVNGTWNPDLTGGPTSSDSTICKPCCIRVFAGLLYHFRRGIPRDALPPNVTARANCWYGKECHTQFKNVLHAQNYNHACPQEKRKE